MQSPVFSPWATPPPRSLDTGETTGPQRKLEFEEVEVAKAVPIEISSWIATLPTDLVRIKPGKDKRPAKRIVVYKHTDDSVVVTDRPPLQEDWFYVEVESEPSLQTWRISRCLKSNIWKDGVFTVENAVRYFNGYDKDLVEFYIEDQRTDIERQCQQLHAKEIFVDYAELDFVANWNYMRETAQTFCRQLNVVALDGIDLTGHPAAPVTKAVHSIRWNHQAQCTLNAALCAHILERETQVPWNVLQVHWEHIVEFAPTAARLLFVKSLLQIFTFERQLVQPEYTSGSVGEDMLYLPTFSWHPAVYRILYRNQRYYYLYNMRLAQATNNRGSLSLVPFVQLLPIDFVSPQFLENNYVGVSAHKIAAKCQENGLQEGDYWWWQPDSVFESSTITKIVMPSPFLDVE